MDFKTLAPAESLEVRVELIKLRNIKNRISVLRMLADCGELPGDPELKKWLEIRNQIF